MKPEPPVTSMLFGCLTEDMSLSLPFFQRSAHRLRVLALPALVHEARQLRGSDETHAVGDLFDAGDRRALTTLERGHEVSSVQQALLSSGIEPGLAATEDLEASSPGRHVAVADVDDLQLAARRRLEILGDLHHLVVEEIQAGDGQAALRLLWLLFHAQQFAVWAYLGDTIALGVVDTITEEGRTVQLVAHALELLHETGTIKDIVAQNQAHRVGTDELTANDEGLGQAVRRRLHGIAEAHAELFTGAQKELETWQILWGGNDQHVPDAGQHQHRQRVVDHRLVVDGQKLLGDDPRQRIESRSTATR